MSRRQALGVISNQYTNNQLVNNTQQNDNLKPVHPFKSHPSLTNIANCNKNENLKPFKKNGSSDFDFEIFQEEEEKFNDLALIDKENVGNFKQENIIFSNDFEDDLENKDVCSKTDKESDNSLNVLMENSPMILDDTIKPFSSKEEEELQRENSLVNCNEYKDEILTYMRQEELVNRPKSNYMKKQQDINVSMRSILIDWLVEVSEEYKLNTETLYLAVNYTDRFLSQMSVLRGKLQLVGTASMYIAAKYEEVSPPDVEEFVYITDDTYTKKQVLRMEHLLLKVLDFRMNTPTINNFLTHYLRFLKMNGLNKSDKVEHLARYLAELTLIESDTYLEFQSSQIAASAIYLSMNILDKEWTQEIADELGYEFDLSELKDCITAMHTTMKEAPLLPQQAIQEKYKSHRFLGVASLDAPDTISF
jgi:hypothetical protein